MTDERKALTRELHEEFWPALSALLQASIYALDANCTKWNFAISIQRLLKLGLSETDLRWLTQKGFVEHGREVTIEGDDGREFRSTGNMTFSHQTCFILSEAGIKATESQFNPTKNGRVSIVTNNGLVCDNLTPQWVVESRKLKLNDQLVKRFKWPAANQEAVLCAFEEEGWPERIDDPLPPQHDQDPKRRLADTIKCLNRKQVNELIRFHGDGTGEGVVWEQLDGNH